MTTRLGERNHLVGCGRIPCFLLPRTPRMGWSEIYLTFNRGVEAIEVPPNTDHDAECRSSPYVTLSLTSTLSPQQVVYIA